MKNKIIYIFLFCLIFFVIIFLNKDINEDIDENEYSSSVYVFYDGEYYVYSGEFVYSVPSGYELSGNVNLNILTNNLHDFDGNEEGYVYIDKSDLSYIIFQWRDWDKNVDGKEPYLILYKYHQ